MQKTKTLEQIEAEKKTVSKYRRVLLLWKEFDIETAGIEEILETARMVGSTIRGKCANCRQRVSELGLDANFPTNPFRDPLRKGSPCLECWSLEYCRDNLATSVMYNRQIRLMCLKLRRGDKAERDLTKSKYFSCQKRCLFYDECEIYKGEERVRFCAKRLLEEAESKIEPLGMPYESYKLSVA